MIPMKIEKLPSGSYRIRKMYKGQMYTVVTDHKPTQKEAIKLLAEELDKITTSYSKLTFYNAATEYIESKRNVLSPSTIRSYMGILHNLSATFTKKTIANITNLDVQREINDYSKTRSPKTVRNANGFISAVMKMFSPQTIINTTLPQNIKKSAYIPTDEDVKAIITASKGSNYEIPLILAVYGMRRSEICALTLDDINGNMITINKAKVQDEHGDWIIKTTKTTDSTRTIYVPDEIINKIIQSGTIYDGDPSRISRYLAKKQSELGLPHFSLHKLRHYYASMSHSLGIPDQYIMANGGWKTDNVLKNVYQHAMADKQQDMLNFAAEYIKEIVIE